MSDLDKDRADRLRVALRESTGDKELDDLFNASLYASISSNPDAVVVYREETAPEQAMLDLHLEGEGVAEHATSASKFGTFVTRLSQATKQTAKAISNKQRYSENLLIEGLRHGSVRVILRVPDTHEVQPAEVLPDSVSDSADSMALKQIARIFTNASDDDSTHENSALLAQVSKLPQAAQRLLKSAVTEVLDARWEIAGELLQQRKPIEPVRLSPRGAARIQSTIHYNPAPPETETRIGVFDGLRMGRGVAYFEPRDGRRVQFSAAVSDEDLLRRIAALLAARDQNGSPIVVQAEFEKYAEEAEPGVAARYSRALRTFVPIEDIKAIEDPFDLEGS